MHDTAFKFVGLVACALFICAILFVLAKVPTNPAWSLSKHAASRRAVWLVYESILSLGVVLFYIFFTQWFIPEFNLSIVFWVIITAIVSLQLVGNWLPDKNDSSLSARLHVLLYSLSGALFPVLLGLIALSPIFSLFSRVFAWIAIATSITFMLLFLLIKQTHAKFLWYQISYFLLFLTTILSAAYT